MLRENFYEEFGVRLNRFEKRTFSAAHNAEAPPRKRGRLHEIQFTGTTPAAVMTSLASAEVT